MAVAETIIKTETHHIIGARLENGSIDLLIEDHGTHKGNLLSQAALGDGFERLAAELVPSEHMEAVQKWIESHSDRT